MTTTAKTIAEWQEAVMRATASGDPSAVVTLNHEPTQWLRDRFRRGPTSWCEHITLPIHLKSMPAVLTLSDAHLSCGDCRPRRGSVTSACDRCGRVCADQPEQERVRYGHVIVGPVVVVAALCPGCADREFPQ